MRNGKNKKPEKPELVNVFSPEEISVSDLRDNVQPIADAPVQDEPAAMEAEVVDFSAMPEEDSAPANAPQEEPDSEEAAAIEMEEAVSDKAASDEASIQSMPVQEESEPALAEDVAEGAATVESATELPPLSITSIAQAKAVAEALLFSSSEPLSLKRLAKLMGEMNANDLRGILTQLSEDYQKDGRGIQLVEIAGGFQLATRPEYAEWILALHGQKRRSPLTGAALETLAIIAYKQPITRAEVDAIRGVESGGVVRTLLDLELIEVKGRKEVLGKPQLYGTSEKFLHAFGLRQLEDLPSIQELRERYQTGQKP